MIALDVAVYISIRIELQFIISLYMRLAIGSQEWRLQIFSISGQTEHVVAVVASSGPCTAKEIFSYNQTVPVICSLCQPTDVKRYLFNRGREYVTL